VQVEHTYLLEPRY